MSATPTGQQIRAEERRQHLRREADEIAERRADVIRTDQSQPVKLVDCEVCAGTGAMTARRADQPDAAPVLIPCPACAGRGATLQRHPAATRA